jgi:transposase
MAINQTIASSAQAAAAQTCWPQTSEPSECAQGDLVRAQDRHSLGIPSGGDALRQRHDLLATPAGLATKGRLETPAPGSPEQTPGHLGAGNAPWEKTGPSPVDRRKYGTKHHLLVDGQGRVPLAFSITEANRNDITQLMNLVDAVPAIAGKRGHPRRRPESSYGDRGYDSDPHRRKLRQRGIRPHLGRRRTAHGSGMGVYRWVVERAESWVHKNRRLKLRYERRDDLHEAFVALACALICHNCLIDPFC